MWMNHPPNIANAARGKKLADATIGTQKRTRARSAMSVSDLIPPALRWPTFASDPTEFRATKVLN